jgi:hypothetical protein
MTENFGKSVADVATQRMHYVPPQMEVVELDTQGAILMASTSVPKSFGARFGDDEEESW